MNYETQKVVLADFLAEGKDHKILPLFTKRDLAQRWGVSRQVIDNWSRRYENFCVEIPDIMAGRGEYKGGGPLYPLYEVERFEKIKGVKS